MVIRRRKIGVGKIFLERDTGEVPRGAKIAGHPSKRFARWNTHVVEKGRQNPGASFPPRRRFEKTFESKENGG